MEWHEIRRAGVVRIDRVVAEFTVWVDNTLPFAKFRVKIHERPGHGFLAVPNVAIKSLKTQSPEFTAGMGLTVEAALSEALDYFWKELEANAPKRPLTEDDFSWSAAEDF